MPREEKTDKKELQSINLLQKLIRLDSKDSNFVFKDQLRKAYFRVSNPHWSFENPTNDGLLRQFWYHVQCFYFRKMQRQDLKRLNYLIQIFEDKNMDVQQLSCISHRPILINRDFDRSLNQIMSDEYLSRLSKEITSQKDSELWVKTVFLQNKYLKVSQKMNKEKKMKTKLIYSKLKQNRMLRNNLKSKKAIKKALKAQQQQIDLLIKDSNIFQDQQKSQIDIQIYKLQNQLKLLSNQNIKVVNSLINQVQQQIIQQQAQHQEKSSRSITSNTKISNPTLQCLQYLINCLEQKQIAQSIVKIISTQRFNGQIMFQILFEKAMNLQPRLISQKQLTRANFLRQTSLFNFYRTGVKSLYSYICHNYVGFRQLMQNRMSITSKFKDKCMLQMMKKGACLASVSQIQHQMNKFNSCHHCKFLYPQYMLFTCKFISDKQSVPKYNLQMMLDPTFQQYNQEFFNKSRTSQRFLTRKKNCFTSYAKIHDEYVCGRKYCYGCLRDNYWHENIKQNGLCPFCLGVCICTRCLRNEKLAKIKSIYSGYGGDLNILNERSQIEMLQMKNQQILNKGRGRPKKPIATQSVIFNNKKKIKKSEDKENWSLSDAYVPRRTKKKLISHEYILVYFSKQADTRANDTPEQQGKRKIKRHPGRPRLNKAILLQRNRKKI